MTPEITPRTCDDGKEHDWDHHGGSDTVIVFQCRKCRSHFVYDKLVIRNDKSE